MRCPLTFDSNQGFHARPRDTVCTVVYEQQCPRCGAVFTGDDKQGVADAVVAHARDEHRHVLDPEVVLAHLEGVHPHERET